MPRFVIHYRKKDKLKYIIWTELFLVCFVGFFVDVFGIPSIIKYSIDLLNTVLGFYIINKLIRQKKAEKSTQIILLLVGLFMLLSFVFWIPNAGDPVLLLWGARNTFRFLVFFVACILFLDMGTIEKMLGKLNLLIIINFLICVIEFAAMGYSGDYIGGGFGISQGCNAPLNVLLVIVTIYNAIKYTNKDNSLLKTVIYIGLCSGIAGMAELKVYVVEVVLVIAIVGAFSKGFLKKTIIVIVGLVFSIVSIHLIEYLIPGWEGFFTFRNMYNMVSASSGYTNSGDLNRLTSISGLNQLFFGHSINWIGFGLGNCEYSDSFSFLNSTFSQKYWYLHYAWFSVAKIYLELGWFGIVASLSVWGYTLYTALRKLKSSREHKILVAAISIMAIFFFFYNFTMNLDAAYLVYAVLAIAYIYLKRPSMGGNND